MTTLIADQVEAALHDELRSNAAELRRLVDQIDPAVLANSVLALLKERDQRSPHFLLAFALRNALDARINELFEARFEEEIRKRRAA